MSQVKDFFDSLAPNWDAQQSKTKEQILPLLHKIGIKEGDRVLDLACGTGTITSYLHELSSATVVGVDISEGMIDIAKKKYETVPWAEFVCGDFLSLSFEKKFDVVVLYNAYPHFMDPRSLAEAFSKTLNPNGVFAIVHSLGRKALDMYHSNVPCAISRSLLSPEQEAKNFAPYFEIKEASEGEDFYFILGKKIN